MCMCHHVQNKAPTTIQTKWNERKSLLWMLFYLFACVAPFLRLFFKKWRRRKKKKNKKLLSYFDFVFHAINEVKIHRIRSRSDTDFRIVTKKNTNSKTNTQSHLFAKSKYSFIHFVMREFSVSTFHRQTNLLTFFFSNLNDICQIMHHQNNWPKFFILRALVLSIHSFDCVNFSTTLWNFRLRTRWERCGFQLLFLTYIFLISLTPSLSLSATNDFNFIDNVKCMCLLLWKQRRRKNKKKKTCSVKKTAKEKSKNSILHW